MNNKKAVKQRFFKAVILLAILTMGIAVSSKALASDLSVKTYPIGGYEWTDTRASASACNSYCASSGFSSGAVTATGFKTCAGATCAYISSFTTGSTASVGNDGNCGCNSQFTCSCVSATDTTWQLTKDSYYVSVPLNLNSYELGETAKVGNPIKMTPAGCVTSIYRWNSSLYEKTDYIDNWGWWPATASENFTKLEPGRGYVFIVKNDSCKVEFTGNYPTQPVDVSLKKGYNIVSWHSASSVVIAGKVNVLKTTPENCVTEISETDPQITNAAGIKINGQTRYMEYKNSIWTPLPGSESFMSLVPGKGYAFITDKDCTFSSGEVIAEPIVKSIKVISPNGGEQWDAGKAYNITWNSTGYDKVKVNVRCDTYSSSYMPGAIMDVPSGTTGGSYLFNIPVDLTPQTNCRVYVSENVGMSQKLLPGVNDDYSDNFFNIINPASKYILVTFPGGAESLIRGNTYEIAWDFKGINSQELVSIGLNGGASSGIIHSGLPIGDKKYLWKIPVDYNNSIDLGSVRMRIASTSDSSIYNDSRYFSIVGSLSGPITVISPNGGEKWVLGSSYDITWSSSMLSKVNIRVYADGRDMGMIATGVDATKGKYLWTIPVNFGNGIIAYNLNAVKIRVESSDNPSAYFDNSDNNFSIVSTPSSCILPDGTLVKLPNDPKVYVIRDCKKYWIRSVEEFTNSGYKWSDVNELPSTTVNSIPDTSDITPTATIPEGSMIQVIGDPDVYIVKYMGAKKFKRLILNPSVFKSYGHLKWENIIKVSKATLDSFTTSTLVKSENGKIYRLVPNGDAGVRNHVRDMNAFQRLALDMDSVYQINIADENSYNEGEEL